MNSKLPQQLDWELASNRWASLIDPVITSPLVQNNILTNVPLVTGDNVINHKLGRKLQGWMVCGINAAASIYDKQASNQTPQLTLVLNASADATVNLVVF